MTGFKNTITSIAKQLLGRKKIYWLSFIVGIVSGAAALILKNLIHFIGETLVGHFKETNENYLYLAFPLVGIIITILILKYLIKDEVSHGIAKILY